MKYSKTKTSTNLVTYSNSSTSKAATVWQELFPEGTNVETSSQSGIYWSIITETIKLKEKKMKKTPNLENWSLNFDGKRTDGHEY